MENDNNIIINDDLITRYLSGEANPEEAIALHNWLNDHVNRNYFEEIKTTWHAAFPSRRPRLVNTSTAWSKVTIELNRSFKEERPSRQLSPRFYYSIAASVVFILTAVLTFYFTRIPQVSDIIVSTKDTTRRIDFADNSLAVLYHNSTLSYPKTFDGQTREVHLATGEAFFKVVPNKAKPFIIHTSVGEIKVVGTAFNVVANNGHLEVGVNEGSVLLYTEDDSVMIEAGSTGEVNADDQSIAVKQTIDPNVWGYATNIFTFKDTPLREVISSIQKAYPYTIQVTEENINNCRLTATFEKVSVENMLDLIAETLNLSATRDGKMFILEGEGCP